FMHALFLRNLTINPLILKVFALTKVGETSALALSLKEREFLVWLPLRIWFSLRLCVFASRSLLYRRLPHHQPRRRQMTHRRTGRIADALQHHLRGGLSQSSGLDVDGRQRWIAVLGRGHAVEADQRE